MSASAQVNTSFPLGVEPLAHSRGGTVEGCGLRVTGGRAEKQSGSMWFDVSFNVYRRGFALVQAIAYEMPPPRYEEESRPKRVAVQRAWLKPQNADGSTRLGETTEVRETLVYPVTLDEAARLFQAVAAGEPLLIGFRAWGQARESVFGGTASLGADGRDRLAACFNALVN